MLAASLVSINELPAMSACGPSRRFAAAQQFSRFKSEADIQRDALTGLDL
jgi:hypothetical protein